MPTTKRSVSGSFNEGRKTPRRARDQMGHYAARGMSGKPCPHRCCQGKRVHPDKLPVSLDRDYLRSLTPVELGQELAQYTNYAEHRENGLSQITAEIERRPPDQVDWVYAGYEDTLKAQDERAQLSGKLRENARQRRLQRVQEYKDEVYRQWLQAEAETNGYMLNKAGKAAGIDERSLFTGPQSRVAKYASRELRDYFDKHGRPTRVSFLGSAYARRAHLAGQRAGASGAA